MRKNKLKLFLLMAVCIAVTTACGLEKIKTKKTKDMDFTVVAENEMPTEIQQIVEERKEKEFKVAYSDAQYTYIIIGYGKQKFEGYSIKVKEMYETENAIYVKTEFEGPKEYSANETDTYPYIVIKIEYSDKNVIFSE